MCVYVSKYKIVDHPNDLVCLETVRINGLCFMYLDFNASKVSTCFIEQHSVVICVSEHPALLSLGMKTNTPSMCRCRTKYCIIILKYGLLRRRHNLVYNPACL